jgi:hypothetical protein
MVVAPQLLSNQLRIDSIRFQEFVSVIDERG